MKVALNLSFEKLTPFYFRFASEIGCDGIICHLNTYDSTWGGESNDKSTMTPRNKVWNFESMAAIKKAADGYGLELYGIENLNPFDWYDVLLAGEKRDEQLEYIREIIRNMGRAGIRYLGYNFSLSGVYGRKKKRSARGGAETMCFSGSDDEVQEPVPDGMVWNTWIKPGKFHVDEISNEELWSRWQYFMENIIAEAEENDVILAAHPDDPPMQRLRSNARLVNAPEGFYRLVDSVPSPCNKLELCIGTLQEMEGDFDLYANIASLCKRDAVGYVHLRNVKGKVPEYTETLIDDGDIDIPRAIRMLAENGFSGPIVPDHTPYLDCKEPWLSGMAFQIGYIRACIDSLSL